MRIPWKLKSGIFWLIDITGTQALLSICSKYLTRRSLKHARSMNPDWETHRDLIHMYYGEKVQNLFEFGAGKSLKQNLFLSTFVDRQIVYDLNKFADLDLINTAINSLKQHGILSPESSYLNSLTDLETHGIEYYAPADARSTHLKNHQIDICVSTDTLEHIPTADLRKIFLELKRVIRPLGLVIAKIDYTDHYSHTDPSIPPNNFHKFSNVQWLRYNHASHYQNRLQHHEYKDLFVATGFKVVHEEKYFSRKSSGVTEKSARCFNTAPQDSRQINQDQLFIHSAFFVLQNIEKSSSEHRDYNSYE